VRRRRLRHWLGAGAILLVLIVTVPVVGIESSCRAPGAGTRALPTGRFGINDAGYARATTNSVLSYPEWYIVYAYQDFAAVLATGDEHRFRYLASVEDYWTGFCAVNRVAAAQGGSEADEKAMLYVIGVSFTAEMAIKGAYETTVGWLFAWLRGDRKTNEDRLALAVASEYAGFLGQEPWYLYPFRDQVHRLWHDTAFDWSSPVRAAERRFALTAEWSVKTVYAKAIGAAAGLSPADLDIESVVGGLDEADHAADPAIEMVRPLDDGKQLIRTPRYAAFTQILLDLSARGRPIYEIAGNDRIFATLLVPPDVAVTMPGLQPIFADEIQSRPGWRRQGVELAVPMMSQAMAALQARGVVVEHLYDY